MWFFPFFLLPCLPQGWHKSPCGQTTKKPRFTKCGFFVFSSFLASHRGDIRARLGIIFVLSCVVVLCLRSHWWLRPFWAHMFCFRTWRRRSKSRCNAFALGLFEWVDGSKAESRLIQSQQEPETIHIQISVKSVFSVACCELVLHTCYT